MNPADPRELRRRALQAAIDASPGGYGEDNGRPVGGVVRRGWRADIERSLMECGLAPGSVLWWAFEIERVRQVPRGVTKERKASAA